MHIGIFSTPAVVPDPNRGTYLVEQTGCGHLSTHAPFAFSFRRPVRKPSPWLLVGQNDYGAKKCRFQRRFSAPQF